MASRPDPARRRRSAPAGARLGERHGRAEVVLAVLHRHGLGLPDSLHYLIEHPAAAGYHHPPTSASAAGAILRVWPTRTPIRSCRALQSDWEQLAERDAFHAVLSDPEKAHGGWDTEAFYASGRTGVDEFILPFVAEHGVTLTHGAALEFGCGPGRLSFALARHFDRVVGVDISAPMLERAREYGIPTTASSSCRTIPRSRRSRPSASTSC